MLKANKHYITTAVLGSFSITRSLTNKWMSWHIIFVVSITDFVLVLRLLLVTAGLFVESSITFNLACLLKIWIFYWYDYIFVSFPASNGDLPTHRFLSKKKKEEKLKTNKTISWRKSIEHIFLFLIFLSTKLCLQVPISKGLLYLYYILSI